MPGRNEAPLDRSTDLGHCLFLILEVTNIEAILFKKQKKMGVEQKTAFT